MKLAADIAKKSLNPFETEGKIVELIAIVGGYKSIPPTNSLDLCCISCGGKDHYAIFDNTDKFYDKRVWICGNGLCLTNEVKKWQPCTITPVQSKRAILWHVWCEINGVGDINHNVRFEDMKQSSAKISYLSKYAEKPNGIIFMTGSAGNGKTYAALATCELFTRTNISCVFMTQKQMFNMWSETFKTEIVGNFFNQITKCNLLVIDDFGTAEMSPTFLSFFMDLLNTRLQWSDRGTIITTNLNDQKFSLYCGEALADRITTGQKFFFDGDSRRKKTTL